MPSLPRINEEDPQPAEPSRTEPSRAEEGQQEGGRLLRLSRLLASLCTVIQAHANPPLRVASFTNQHPPLLSDDPAAPDASKRRHLYFKKLQTSAVSVISQSSLT